MARVSISDHINMDARFKLRESVFERPLAVETLGFASSPVRSAALLCQSRPRPDAGSKPVLRLGERLLLHPQALSPTRAPTIPREPCGSSARHPPVRE